MLDVAVSEEIVDLRWSPLTAVMLLLSAWWVKDLAFVLAAAARDLRRRRVPWSVLPIGVAAAIASQAATLLKSVFDRPRPFAQGLWSGLGSLPHSGSMPSGHAATAAAAATALGMLVPGARPAAYVLAALICVSRVYLGVHFASDVLAGAALGALIGAGVVVAVRRLLGDRLADPTPPARGSRRRDTRPAT
jgi:membrane-associated phospholipid phosphatase